MLHVRRGPQGGPLSGFSMCDDGVAVVRNAGANPQSLACDVPVIGVAWTATVDLTTTGHDLAGVLGFASPANFPLAGGTVLLVDVTNPGGEPR